MTYTTDHISSVLSVANAAMRDIFGSSIERSRLVTHSDESWDDFASSNETLQHTTGCFDPVLLRAHVKKSSAHLVPDLFHELYGHGFLLERSPIGKLFADSQRTALPELMASNRHEPYGILNPLRENLEAFAHWLESELCERTGHCTDWKRKEAALPTDAMAIYAYATGIQQRFTTLGFAKQYGIPMMPRKDAVKAVLLENFPIDRSKGDFAVLYGSRKPASDIDVFVVTDNIEGNVYWGWLDVYVLSHEQLIGSRHSLDLSVTDPIFTGDLVVGDDVRFECLRESLRQAPITQECIAYAEQASRAQDAFAADTSLDDEMRGKQARYAMCYQRQAAQMREGRKALTLRELSSSASI